MRRDVCDRLRFAAGAVSSELQCGSEEGVSSSADLEPSPVPANADVAKEQSCYLPVSMDGTPIMGRVPGLEAAYVATGHSCWGILNAPATGLAMAELIADGEARCCDIGPFDPARLFV